mmetsp:Transcript_21203/g.47118  ORF Transcript_21203/g.47118 Transcript_21203/m.47118 type:complete len:109 (+) Transcript_21203:281-607(+)
MTAGQADESESERAEPIADDAPRSLPFSLEVSALRADSERDSASSVHSRRPPRPPSIEADCRTRLEEMILGSAKAEGEEGAGGDATQKPKGCRGGTSEWCHFNPVRRC